jgi:hypothetical protein
MPKAPQVLLPQALHQAVIDYLKKQPYEQVHRLIGGLVNCPAASVVADSESLPPKE